VCYVQIQTQELKPAKEDTFFWAHCASGMWHCVTG